MFTVRRYEVADATAWDALVMRSRNGNLLHRRGYMDYHAHRFTDASLVVEHGGDIVGVFPANRQEDTVSSHGGLTYAGLITSHALRAEATLGVFGDIRDVYRDWGIVSICYKAVPHVYHAYPAEEDLYALHRWGARLARRDLSSAIPLHQAHALTQGRKAAGNKARKAGVVRQEGNDPAAFHALLIDVLRRHDVTPTHSLPELRLLQGRFPHQIVLHEARRDGELLAGVLIYDFGHAVHTQYMAVSGEGRRVDALSFLLVELIGSVYADRAHFTFGISTAQGGQVLNGGLVAQKEFFGARAVVHDIYEWVL
ncbi:GNAT family N-acetyltransferase [Pinirhizobacter sp.]|uniref:GNAT family N-acetyltransferase n=1 Tax=Pinirhizobacter sp. TaxID=2950432 RepID=UPI002F4176F0